MGGISVMLKGTSLEQYFKLRDDRQTLVDNFIDEYLKISYEIEGNGTKEFSDMYHFNLSLPENIINSEYLNGKTIGEESQPLLSFGFPISVIEETFRHNINGMFLRVQYILDNYKVFAEIESSPWCRVDIKYHKDGLPKSFTFIDRHQDKVNVTLKYEDGIIVELTTQVPKGVVVKYTLKDNYSEDKRGYEEITNKHLLIQHRHDINKFFMNLSDVIIDIKETLGENK